MLVRWDSPPSPYELRTLVSIAMLDSLGGAFFGDASTLGAMYIYEGGTVLDPRCGGMGVLEAVS